MLHLILLHLVMCVSAESVFFVCDVCSTLTWLARVHVYGVRELYVC